MRIITKCANCGFEMLHPDVNSYDAGMFVSFHADLGKVCGGCQAKFDFYGGNFDSPVRVTLPVRVVKAGESIIKFGQLCDPTS